jgi:inorganic triphosphatase YgiF
VTTEAGREVELKLEVAPGDLPALKRHRLLHALTQGRATTRQLRSVYFDTPEGDLARRHVALRLRTSGTRWVQTLKTPNNGVAGLFVRGEWEVPVAGDRPDLARIADPLLREELSKELAGKPLEPIFETELRRTRRVLREEGNELLCELDVGELRCAAGRLPICELELELREGDPGYLYQLALELLADVTLRPALESKGERGQALLTGAAPGPRKAGALCLDRHASLEDVLAAVWRSCLEQIATNEEPAREGRDPEGVHQMRVGVRRLRSALSLFRPVLPAGATAPVEAELRWLGGSLGPVRDLDVFVESLVEPLLRLREGDASLLHLADEARRTRRLAQQRLREDLSGRRLPRLLLEIGRFVATARWRDQPLSAASSQLFQPARSFGDVLLTRRLEKARRLGERLETLTPAERHRLRIQLKKLRYASEFLRSLYPEKRAARYVERLAALQDVLGEWNDAVIAERLLGDLLGRMGPAAGTDLERAAGFVLGWNARATERHARRLPRLWQKLAATEPFWKRPQRTNMS